MAIKVTQLQVRCSQELKDKFQIWCEENGTDPSHEVRRYMTIVTKDIVLPGKENS